MRLKKVSHLQESSQRRWLNAMPKMSVKSTQYSLYDLWSWSHNNTFVFYISGNSVNTILWSQFHACVFITPNSPDNKACMIQSWSEVLFCTMCILVWLSQHSTSAIFHCTNSVYLFFTPIQEPPINYSLVPRLLCGGEARVSSIPYPQNPKS